ncbi:hypothetical protein J6590_065033 [Homalodisca vitripennis]|nr:hypothetical protein J6590_065033 [Homalodisca vitripennis]
MTRGVCGTRSNCQVVSARDLSALVDMPGSVASATTFCNRRQRSSPNRVVGILLVRGREGGSFTGRPAQNELGQ